MTLNHVGEDVDLVERVQCPICLRDESEQLRAARYPTGITRPELRRIFSSSSSDELLDRVVRCRVCSLVYLNPRVRSDIIAEGYAGAEDPTFFAQNPMRIATFTRAWRSLGHRLGLDPRRTRVLDVGSAGGAFVKAAADLGYSTTGVEPSKWLCARGRAEYGIDLRTGTLEAQRFEAGSYDVATLWDVIEHLSDPGAVLREIRRVLRPGGYLVVNFPDYGSIARHAMGWTWPFFLNVHLFYFSRATITSLLARESFVAIDARPFWQTLELGYVFERAAKIVAPLGGLASTSRALGLARLPLTYQMGQTQVVARAVG